MRAFWPVTVFAAARPISLWRFCLTTLAAALQAKPAFQESTAGIDAAFVQDLNCHALSVEHGSRLKREGCRSPQLIDIPFSDFLSVYVDFAAVRRSH